MRDPRTVAHEIKSPFKSKPTPLWPEGYRNTLVTIWHCDPETDGTDDSCGWFMRSRHGDPAMFESIRSRFAFEWDSDTGGWFLKDGSPRLPVQGIVLQMFWTAAWEFFGHDSRKANRFLNRNLVDILLFSANNVDSLFDGITQRYGPEKREDRIEHFSSCVYSWILRTQRPWWRHPKWHVHHWRLQVHPWQQLRRRIFDRCQGCGKRFGWNESPVGIHWDQPRTRWFRSAVGLFHHECSPGGGPRVQDDAGEHGPAKAAEPLPA